MTAERRHHARIAFHAPARLLLGEPTLDVVVLDLSLKGALIRLPANTAISEGTSGMLNVQLNESEAGEQISMQIRVAYVEGPQAGVLCISIDIDSVTHLRRLLELNFGDAALLERELSALIAE
jgi:hypothetical protein